MHASTILGRRNDGGGEAIRRYAKLPEMLTLKAAVCDNEAGLQTLEFHIETWQIWQKKY